MSYCNGVGLPRAFTDCLLVSAVWGGQTSTVLKVKGDNAGGLKSRCRLAVSRNGSNDHFLSHPGDQAQCVVHEAANHGAHPHASHTGEYVLVALCADCWGNKMTREHRGSAGACTAPSARAWRQAVEE